MAFAITYTIRNEQDWIEDALAIHRRLGCKRFYVFLDNSTDRTREILRKQPTDVQILETEKPSREPGEEWPRWVSILIASFTESMDARKRINTWRACRLARLEGIEWLVSIDVDEVLYFSEARSIDVALEALPARIDQVLMVNLELLPTPSSTLHPLRQRGLFLRRLWVADSLWRWARAVLRKCHTPPRLLAWLSFFFFWTCTLGALPRLYRSPSTGKFIPAEHYLGYKGYKSIIRCERAGDSIFDVHGWTGDSQKLRNIVAGQVLHYYLPHSAAFINKFRQRGSGARVHAFFAIDQMAQIALECTEEAASSFFDNNLCVSDQRAIERLVRRGWVKEIDIVCRLLSG